MRKHSECINTSSAAVSHTCFSLSSSMKDDIEIVIVVIGICLQSHSYRLSDFTLSDDNWYNVMDNRPEGRSIYLV